MSRTTSLLLPVIILLLCLTCSGSVGANENDFIQTTKLLASDGAEWDQFGNSVSISGDRVLVGATSDSDDGYRSGSAYIFSRNHGGADNWGQAQKINASDGAEDDLFGRSVAISRDRVLVGAFCDDDIGIESGSAYVFVSKTIVKAIPYIPLLLLDE